MDEEEKMVHISEVRGGQTALICPYCHTSLIAKKGDRLTHHFAHSSQSCKEVEKGELDGLSVEIPFYSDFFSEKLSETERRALKVLHSHFGMEFFHRKGKTGSAFQLFFLNDIQNIYQVWDRLVDSLHIQQKGNWFQLTRHAEIGLSLLPLASFAEIQRQRLYFFELALDASTDPVDFLRKKVYDNLKARLLEASLYCLHIPGLSRKADVWKIGISTRSAAQRLKELMPVIEAHFGEKRASLTKIVYEQKGLGRLESYIKKRFAGSQYPLLFRDHVYTEFFADPGLVEELCLL